MKRAEQISLFAEPVSSRRRGTAPKGDGVPDFVIRIDREGEILRTSSKTENRWVGSANLEIDAICCVAGREMSVRWRDLATIAHAAYLADRVCPRRATHEHGWAIWKRRLHVEVEVIDLSFWSGESVVAALRDALGFLSGDDWTFALQRLPETSVPNVCVQMAQPVSEGSIEAAVLFSGGLDGLAAAERCLRKHEGRVMLVSGCTHHVLDQTLKELFGMTREIFGPRVVPVIVGHGVDEAPMPDDSESSQRTRGFFHASLGACAAGNVGLSEITMGENGPGCWNLPIDASQTGLPNSRAAHPGFVRRCEKLLSLVAGRSFRINNPLAFETKGEVLRDLQASRMAGLMPHCVSCDRPPQHRRRYRNCGSCPSCLARRVAQAVAEDGRSSIDAWKWEYRHVGAAVMHGMAGEVLTKLDRQARRWHELLRAPDGAGWWLADNPTVANELAALPAGEFEPQLEQWAALYRRAADQWLAGSLALRCALDEHSLRPAA